MVILMAAPAEVDTPATITMRTVSVGRPPANVAAARTTPGEAVVPTPTVTGVALAAVLAVLTR